MEVVKRGNYKSFRIKKSNHIGGIMMKSEQELIRAASDYQFKTKELKRAYLIYCEILECSSNSQTRSLAQSMMQKIEAEDEEIKKQAALLRENWKVEMDLEEQKRTDFANSFNEYYEYDVVSVINAEHGVVDKSEMKRVLMEHARQGWKLHTIYSNELGKNALRILGFGINSTACEDILIFERRVEKL